MKGPSLKPGQTYSKADVERLVEVRADLTLFVRSADAEVLTAALFDAHLILSHVMHAKLDGVALKRIVAAAKAIGKLGDSIDQYIKAGGSVSDDGKTGEAGQIFSSDESPGWSATATADGGGAR